MQQHLEVCEPRVFKGADVSEDGLYRYRLWRVWDRNLPTVLWVMLNPSKADAELDDATIRRCIGFAKQWGFLSRGGEIVGYGGIEVVNLFAFRATNPKELITATDPVGPENVAAIHRMVDMKPGLIVAAWGNNVPTGYEAHVRTIRDALRSNNALCLGHTRAREPKHPVRLPYATKMKSL